MTAATLDVQNVTWGPARHQPLVLHRAEFRLDAGRVLGIVGPNGAGKTTLLRLIYRHACPTNGTVRIAGRDIWTLSPKTCARMVAAVLQEQPTDFALTVRDVVSLGRLPHRQSFGAPGPRCHDIIATHMDRLGLSHLADRPLGTLSGGERQRAMVARALVQEPQILVLDEPTNHLDIRQQLEVLSLIRDLDITIVTSLHDLNMAADLCDDILLMHNGCQIAFGAAADVLSEERISKVFGVHARREQLSISDRHHLSFSLETTP